MSCVRGCLESRRIELPSCFSLRPVAMVTMATEVLFSFWLVQNKITNRG